MRYFDRYADGYPPCLCFYERMPAGLYVAGQLPDPEKPMVAIIGARKCSIYGKKEAERFGCVLAENGVQVISGLAYGIDVSANIGALQGGGKTFAVLGSGADVCYPKENKDVYDRILASGGGIISEFEPGTEALPWHFPLRNRIISALSDIVLVIEARKKSGSLITVEYALEQGKTIFAIPGRNGDSLSYGCNALISQGAGIALSPEIILEELDVCRERRLTKEEKLAESLETELETDMDKVCEKGVESDMKNLQGKRSDGKEKDWPNESLLLKSGKEADQLSIGERQGVGLTMEGLQKIKEMEDEKKRLPAPWNQNETMNLIYEALGAGEKSLEDIRQATELPLADISNALVILCMEKLVSVPLQGYYVRV